MRRILAITIAILSSSLIFSASEPASAGGGCHSDTLTDGATTQVELSKRCFEPTVVRLQPGDSVTWTNKDPDVHAVSGAANSWGNFNDITAGQSVTYQFDESGVFPYFCYLHPSMVGAVVVGDGSAVSADAAADSVKAVSAQAPGGLTSDEPTEVVEEDSGNGVRTVPIVIAIGLLAAVGGFAGALLLRRKSSPTS
jgi:plastocyanin